MRTKEEKKKYFKELRKSWKESKKLAENDEVMQAIFREAGLNVSYYSFAFAKQQMDKLGYDGIPYVDCQTFGRWKENGFIVRKGEKSKIKGITWISASNGNDDEDESSDFVFPKMYHLFHKSQVENL